MSTTDTALRLAEARTALHALMTGKQLVVLVDPTGRRLEFSPAKRTDLESYIARLEAANTGTPSRRGPFEVTW